MSRKTVSNDDCRAKNDLERSLRTADLASGEEEEVRATEEPEETHRSTCRRATRDSQSLSSPEYGRHNSCKRSEPWTGCQKMCLQRPLSQLQERTQTWRLHKLAAAGDVRAKDIAELTTLRQKQVGLVQEAKNCLNQDMVMMCSRIRSSALLRRTHRCKRLLDDVALRHLLRITMFGMQCQSSAVCALLVIGVLCCWFALVIPHPSSLTVVAPYSDDACAEILPVTVLVVESSLSQAGTQLHVQERLCH